MNQIEARGLTPIRIDRVFWPAVMMYGLIGWANLKKITIEAALRLGIAQTMANGKPEDARLLGYVYQRMTRGEVWPVKNDICKEMLLERMERTGNSLRQVFHDAMEALEQEGDQGEWFALLQCAFWSLRARLGEEAVQ